MPDEAENIAVRAEETVSAHLSDHPQVGFKPPAPVFLSPEGKILPSAEGATCIIQSARRRPAEGGPTVQPERQEYFYPYLRGKLCVLLALGLSHPEAANWAESDPDIIGALLQQDQPFAADVASCRLMARLHPLLRIYLTSGDSWRAAQWLAKYLRGRAGSRRPD